MSAQSDFLRFEAGADIPVLTQAGASHLSNLAFGCISREYPNKIGHVMTMDEDAQAPRELHPAFYGCFDWHSAIHGHWMLVRLLKEFPDLPDGEEIRAAIDQNLQPDKILAEVRYLEHPMRGSFERMYGWAWLLKLCEELHTWEDPQARIWASNLQPLADLIEDRYIDFLPRQTYPIRTGEHPNTAFGLSFAWDYAQALGRDTLRSVIREAALRYFSLDAHCPAGYEPGGADFLSPCLEEANLMRRILAPAAFSSWLQSFLPTLPASLRTPAVVSDRTDGKLVHLDGLNLSRAWCMFGISESLPEGDPRKQAFRQIAVTHITSTLPNIASGSYEGEHWLASFAVFALMASTQ